MSQNDKYVPSFGVHGDPDCQFYKDHGSFGILCLHSEAPSHHTRTVACRPEYCPLLGNTKAKFTTETSCKDDANKGLPLTDPIIKDRIYSLFNEAIREKLENDT